MKILYIKDLKSNSHKTGRSTYFGSWKNTIINHWERIKEDFIYALSADETSSVLAAPRHAITELLSCRFKCPCPTRRQQHFHGNADRAYNTLHFASKVVCQRGTFWKPCFAVMCTHIARKTQNNRFQSAVTSQSDWPLIFFLLSLFSLFSIRIIFIIVMLDTGWKPNV